MVRAHHAGQVCPASRETITGGLGLPVVSIPDRVNSPGRIERLNQHRQWRTRARPKTINHVVFFASDYVRSFEFFRDRLGFRYCDHSRGVGVFARADGTHEHHSIFWVNSQLPVVPGNKPGYMHMAFGVDDIDELMLGANIMERRGDFKFGSLLWAHRVPAIFQTDEVSWDVKLDPHGASLAEFRGPETKG